MARLYGKGTIREIEKGKRYYFELSLGKDPLTGKYRRKCETFHGTRRQCEQRIESLKAAQKLLDDVLALGVDPEERAALGLTDDYITANYANAQRVADDLETRKAAEAERAAAELEAARSVGFADWMEQYLQTRAVSANVRESTLDQERRTSRHLVRVLGDTPIKAIRANDVNAVYARLKAEGTGQSTLVQCHKLLRKVMGYAVGCELVPYNPVDRDRGVEPPKQRKAKRDALAPGEYARLLRACCLDEPSARCTAVYLGAVTGARLGEVMGLQWHHFHDDGERPYLEVVQQLNSKGKITSTKTDDDDAPMGRIVPLPRSSAEFLRSWRAAQRTELLAVGVEPGLDTPIITNARGTWQDRARFSQWFRAWCVDHGWGTWVDEEGREIVELEVGEDASCYAAAGCIVEWHDESGWPCDESGARYSRTHKRTEPKPKRHYDGLVFHELRHTRFTLALADGMDIKTAQALGGWSTTRMLLDCYTHSVDEKLWSSVEFTERYAVQNVKTA